jgi:hypothetical protein
MWERGDSTREVCIGEHRVQLRCGFDLFNRTFAALAESANSSKTERPHIVLDIMEGYGTAFVDYVVGVTVVHKTVYFRRADYLIIANSDYTEAAIFAHNELSLKHAMMTLYSSYIVRHRWGLLIHSSCVVDQGKAHIFAGPSGAGKSTAAQFSLPRELLSDEASLVKITSEGSYVFYSPFRSELEEAGGMKPRLLSSIQLLHQAKQNHRVQYSKTDAFLRLVAQVFYWSPDPKDTGVVLKLLQSLVMSTPVYELQFQKNDTFWELIV